MTALRARSATFATLLAGAAACAPLAPTPPFHLMETAAPLRRGEVAATVAAGGAVNSDMSAGGGGARVRVNVGAGQEIGLEGLVADATWNGSEQESGLHYSGKFSWKGSLADWIALIAGAGFAHASYGTAVGGDVGAVVSTRRPLWRRWVPYSGLRLGLGVPVDGPDRKSTLALTWPVGAALLLGARWQLLAELGWLNAWGGTTSSGSEYVWRSAFFGGVGLTYLFRREPGAAAAEPPPSALSGIRCVDGVTRVAPAGPWTVSLDASLAIGFFFSTHGVVELGIARQLGQRFEVWLDAGFGVGDHLLAGSAAGGAGILLHPAPSLDLLLYWKLGWIHLRTDLFSPALQTEALLASVGVEMRVPLSRRWELRVAPIAVTGYWKGLWGAVVQPRLGLGWRF